MNQNKVNVLLLLVVVESFIKTETKNVQNCSSEIINCASRQTDTVCNNYTVHCSVHVHCTLYGIFILEDIVRYHSILNNVHWTLKNQKIKKKLSYAVFSLTGFAHKPILALEWCKETTYSLKIPKKQASKEKVKANFYKKKELF